MTDPAPAKSPNLSKTTGVPLLQQLKQTVQMAAATKSESPNRKGGKQEQQYSDDESFKSGKCCGCLA